MTFSGIDNQTVELKITSYQNPKNDKGDWDSNWLNIYLNVKSTAGHWQTVDASLTTWDIQELIAWFRGLSANQKPEYNEMEFTEPNLSFHLLNSYEGVQKRIRIIFELESRPVSATDDKEYFVDCMFDNITLEKLSADLKSELDKYPVRKAVR